jgi:glycosyltransferase involved in cell wall biosynthesis
MKIAIWHNMKSGGGNRALQQQMAGLLARGHSVAVWSTPEADNSFPDITQKIPVNIVPWPIYIRFREKYLDNIKTLFFGKDQEIRNIETHSEICAQQIDSQDFDVVLVHSCNLFLMPYIGKFLKKTKSVLYLHEPNRLLLEAWPDKLFWEAPAETKNWTILKNDFLAERRKRVWLREERANYFGYDRVLVNSYFSNESLMRAYGQRGQLCYLGINESDFPFLNLERQPFVMGLGTFYPHKGIETAIEAVAKIPEPRPKLVWVGNDGGGGYYERMCALAKRLNVDFEPLKGVSQHDLVQLLNRATCLVYTSRLEPFGYAPLEANACGLPVVAVAEGGIRETVIDGHNGLLCERDPAALAAAMSQILNDKELFQKLSSQAQAWVKKHWNFDASIDRIEAFLIN